jgi:hypothetical protein
MSIISPTWSGQDLVQTLGRVHRAGAQTPVIQKIVYCAKTYEADICKIIRRKLRNLGGINDGDLLSLNIPHMMCNEDMPTSTYDVILDVEYQRLHADIVV